MSTIENIVIEDPFHLRPVWDAVLEVYCEFVKVCNRHNLRFYMTDGNAIGALRHHGFIPWDDDLDVSMPRPDYEKFLEIAPRELPAYLKIVNARNTPQFLGLFSKIQDSRREKIEAVERECGYQQSNGIFIDIFAIDGYPQSRLAAAIYHWTAFVQHQVMRFRYQKFSDQTQKGCLMWVLGFFLSPFVWGLHSANEFILNAERRNMSHPFESCELTGRSGTTLWKRLTFPKSVWGEPVYVDFDMGMRVPLPHDCDYYLRYDYGDYMKLPPESSRHPTHSYRARCPWWLGPTTD